MNNIILPDLMSVDEQTGKFNGDADFRVFVFGDELWAEGIGESEPDVEEMRFAARNKLHLRDDGTADEVDMLVLVVRIVIHRVLLHTRGEN